MEVNGNIKNKCNKDSCSENIQKYKKYIFQGPVYKNNFFFYHNTLRLMISHSCKDFMIKSGIINHWILPENNLNEHTIYANRSIGNSSEVMQVDSNLNKDLHGVLIGYIQLQIVLVKFSKAILKQMLSAYAQA